MIIIQSNQKILKIFLSCCIYVHAEFHFVDPSKQITFFISFLCLSPGGIRIRVETIKILYYYFITAWSHHDFVFSQSAWLEFLSEYFGCVILCLDGIETIFIRKSNVGTDNNNSRKLNEIFFEGSHRRFDHLKLGCIKKN